MLKVVMLLVAHDGRVRGSQQDLKKKKNLLTQTGVLDRIQMNAGLRQV